MTTEIDKLLSEVKGFDTAIDSQVQELKARQDSRAEVLKKLNIARCQEILRAIDGIVNSFLEIQVPFAVLKQQVIEIQADNSAWWQIPSELGEDGIYTLICDGELKKEKVKSLDLLTFLQKVRAYSKDDSLFKFIT